MTAAGPAAARTAIAGRTLIVILALAATAWFAIAAHQAEDMSRAGAVVAGAGRLSPSQAGQASALLNSAAFLNPDRRVDVLRAQVDAQRGDQRDARRILQQVVKAEPDNLGAWIALLKAAKPNSHEFFAAAYAILHVAPPVHGPR